MTDATPLPEALGGARSVLVLVPGLSSAQDAVCAALLDQAPAEQLHLVGVSYNRGLREWQDHVEAAVGGPPASARLVDASGGGDGSAPTVEAAPDDLTGIEIAATESLPTGDGRTVFCFDSLTALLQYVELDRAYRFLHALVERLWVADARAHFHLDPGAHAAETISTLAALFDAVVAADADALPTGRHTTVDLDGEPVAVARRPAFDPDRNA